MMCIPRGCFALFLLAVSLHATPLRTSADPFTLTLAGDAPKILETAEGPGADQANLTPVPEPSMLMLVGFFLVAFGVFRLKR